MKHSDMFLKFKIDFWWKQVTFEIWGVATHAMRQYSSNHLHFVNSPRAYGGFQESTEVMPFKWEDGQYDQTRVQ